MDLTTQKKIEVVQRLEEIEDIIETRGEELTDEELSAFTEEVNDLMQKRSAFEKEEEKRSKILDDVAKGKGTVKKTFSRETEERTDKGLQAEYRSAWLKHIRDLELTDVEKRAFTSAESSAGAAIPEQTANTIIEKMKLIAPILEKVTLLNVKGALKFAVERSVSHADKHEENAQIPVSDDGLVDVTLTGYEITKLIQISKTVSTMSVDSFESWLTDSLSSAIVKKIVGYIINGTGSSEPKGIKFSNTWDETNSVDVAKAKSLTSDDVYKLISLLNAGYDSTAVFIMTKRTLFTDFMPLQDNAKNNLVTTEGKQYYISGYPVVLVQDEVPHHEAYLGSLDKVVANLSEDINITSQFDINTNSVKFLGSCIFDCKPAISEAFVKLVKKSQ